MKEKADKTWKFWWVYTHICKLETLHETYKIAKGNKGAPGIEGLSFSAIKEMGVRKLIGSDLERAYEALDRFNWSESELIAYEGK